MIAQFDAALMLDHVRALVVTLDGFGQVLAAGGGAGGFLGMDPQELVGRNIMEYVAPSEHDAVATYFMHAAGGTVHTVPRPMPFRSRAVGADGTEHDVDVIPSGVTDEHGEMCGWVVLLVPLALESAAARSLDAELAGEPRRVVRERLCDELSYDNDWGVLRWFYVDFESGKPTVNGPSDFAPIRTALQVAIDAGWQPWSDSSGRRELLRQTPLSSREDFDIDVPDIVREAAAPWIVDRRELRMSCATVVSHGGIVGAYIDVGFLPPEDRLAVSTNVFQRVDRHIDVTRLLEDRWRDQDRLVMAATRDSMTGVANRDTFNNALADADESTAVLYIDVDCFKEVNDRWGHAIGDDVLVEIARRIESCCRPTDLVARFGGDEFVVLLRDVDPATAHQIGERIVVAAGEPLGWERGPTHVTLSVGLAPAWGADDAVDRADRAMLTAKRQGRGRLVAAQV